MTNEHIQARFAELGHTIDLTDIETRTSVLTEQFKVPVKDAESSVVSFFLRQFGVDRANYYEGSSGGNIDVSIADIPSGEGNWVNLRVKFVNEWESTSDFIRQTGLIGDETGQIKFVLWANAGLKEMEKDKCYMLENLVTNVYNDKLSVTFNKTSTITEIDEDVEVGYTTSTFTGVLVSVKSGSGLIKRCTKCNRAMKSGTCAEHGNVEGTDDLRIMAVLDNGIDTMDILLNREMTELVWKHTMEDASVMALNALDASAVVEDMHNALVGRYYTVSGSLMDTMMLVSECEAI